MYKRLEPGRSNACPTEIRWPQIQRDLKVDAEYAICVGVGTHDSRDGIEVAVLGVLTGMGQLYEWLWSHCLFKSWKTKRETFIRDFLAFGQDS